MKIRCPKCGSDNIRLAPTVPNALSECFDCKHFFGDNATRIARKTISTTYDLRY